MRRLLFIVVLGVWFALLTVLVRRMWPASVSPESAKLAVQDRVADEEWMGVYYQQQKIGYTRTSFTPDANGFAFAETSLLRLTVLDTPQTVRTRISGHAHPDCTLRDVDFELSSGAGNLKAHGVVDGHQLRLTLHTGQESTEQNLPLTEPLYLPSTLRASLRGVALHPGKQLTVAAFDPTTLKNDRMTLSVQQLEHVPHASDQVQAWRVVEEFHGITTTAWIDASGSVLREEGPMGFVLIRESADQALHEGWDNTGTVLDLVASAAVPVAQPIAAPRQRQTLSLRLSGIPLDRVPSDDEQSRHGAILTITRRPLRSSDTYELPYHGDQSSELAATAFVQSDHPRIRTLAHQIVGNEHDAQRAAGRLNDWVFDYLKKVPTVSIPNALQVLDMGQGDCNEHAVLLAALGRAAGIPTRMIAGAVYLNSAFFYHAWDEVWLGRWVSVDPALHQFPADATHIKFAVGGPEEQMAMMGIIGRLGVEVVSEASAAPTQ